MTFDTLRTTPWAPTFTWVASPEEAADRINSFHEDYPQRVPDTEWVINRGLPSVKRKLLFAAHRVIFTGESHSGMFRQVNVRVGLHRPPDWDLIPKLMDQLEQTYVRPFTLDTIKDWYWDFETIHPFQDGNGRVGGIVVASFSHTLDPEKGWLAADQ